MVQDGGSLFTRNGAKCLGHRQGAPQEGCSASLLSLRIRRCHPGFPVPGNKSFISLRPPMRVSDKRLGWRGE